MVYIREAHPTDGWHTQKNTIDGVLFKQPTSLAERQKVCTAMTSKMKIELPPLIDDMKDTVNKAYNAWPDRLYLIDVDGKIAFKGGRGPRGFKAGELTAAIEKYLKAPE